MKKILFLFFILLYNYSNILATHNRAGEITFQHISGKTYKISVATYTNTDIATTSADRCEITVYFGDGDSAIIPRINGPANNMCTNASDGEMISTYTKKNIYETTHTYPGDGNYTITMEDPNRNAGICNIPNSVDQSFFIRSQLVINTWLVPNNSPELLNPPIDDACVNVCFEHNPGAFDIDGDSLHYSLTNCYANGQAIFGYSFPPNMNSNSIDAATGDIVWCSPSMLCQYNIAILIKEYRRSPFNNQYYFIGSVIRDMQITVGSCTDTAPKINHVPDTCIVAGSTLNFEVTALTSAQLNFLTIAATGGPFLLSPGASFSSTASPSPVTGQFSWTPNCSQIQLLPYLVTFKASDSHPSAPLVDFESVFIQVIAPAPTGLTAMPSGTSIILNWNNVFCNDTLGSNPLLGYKIYRKNICSPWAHSVCETGVPSYTGYTYIGATTPSQLLFIDDNNGQGLIHGLNYSYLLVAYYADGSESYASEKVCSELIREVPIITNVSVLSTGTNDSIWIHWVKPIGDTSNLDTLANPPPYEYRLMQAQGFNPTANAFTQIASYVQPTFYQLTDTSYISTGLNTKDTAYSFRIDFYSNNLFKSATSVASSVFLKSFAADKKIILSWKEIVPWTNYRYDIYRAIPVGSNNYVKIDTSIASTYIDTGLINGINYCYKIVSVGKYSNTALPSPLYNNSQLKCEQPIDLIPPCQPNFTVEKNCDDFKNLISWTNPNTYCSEDAAGYNVYFSATADGELQLIYSTSDLNTTDYLHEYLFDGIPSVAGCYAVTAIDSVGNESPVVTKLCVDNCPVYELPNVFTPNGDGQNDIFSPLPYRYIKDINIKIYDRWGLLIYETTNPNILWDGKNTSTKKLCSDGTYYYICIVNEIRMNGIVSRNLKGFIQIIQEKNKRNN